MLFECTGTCVTLYVACKSELEVTRRRGVGGGWGGCVRSGHGECPMRWLCDMVHVCLHAFVYIHRE